jgi:cytochrome c2
MGNTCGLLALAGISLAYAQDTDIDEGKKLYEKECLVCHGTPAWGSTGQRLLARPLLAHAPVPYGGTTLVDVGDTSLGIANARLAVAPPFGPNLRGIVGRSAGTVEGFNYSAPFLKSLKGMIWDEHALDVWLTSTQRWVPGVTMYYSQKNPDIRRKIILYLKANP